MGANFGSDALVAAKGGLTGLGQGLQSYGQNVQQAPNMQAFQQGLQQYRTGLKKQPMQRVAIPNYPQSPDMNGSGGY